MPTYEYLCRSCGERLEVVQSFSDDSLTVCDACGGELRKVFSAAGLIFKGSGWHVKDYASGSKGAGGPGGGRTGGGAGSGASEASTSSAPKEASSGSSASSDTKSDTKSSASTETKSSTKSSTKSGTGSGTKSSASD